jgi:hypothetical protein
MFRPIRSSGASKLLLKPKYTLVYAPMCCGASYGDGYSSCRVVCNCYDDDRIGWNMQYDSDVKIILKF